MSTPAGPGPEKINDRFGRDPAIVIWRAGVAYFLLVFGAGFVLGAIRTLWVEPQVGTRLAELLEMPVMLVVIVVTSAAYS